MTIEIFIDQRLGRAQLPPADAVTNDAIKAALVGYGEAKAAAGQARQDAVELAQVERPRAEAEDREQLARALAGGSAPPKRTAVEKADAAIEEAERVAGARQLLEEEALDAVRVAFAEFGDEWAQQAAERVASAETDAQRAIEDLRAAVGRLVEARAIAAFASGADRWRPGAAAPVRVGGRDDVSVDAALAALSEALLAPRVIPADPQMRVH